MRKAGHRLAYSLLQSMTVPAMPRIQQELNTDQSTAA
jgi:hypothetical protein